MILASVHGFFQFLPKLVEEKVSSGTEKNGKNHGKNHPLEETANPVFRSVMCCHVFFFLSKNYIFFAQINFLVCPMADFVD